MEDLPIITAPICFRCMESIKSYGMLCAIVMEQICCHALEGNVSFFDEKEEKKLRPVIKFLELKKYIVSTDIGHHMISVRPLVLTTVLDEYTWDLFCWCEDDDKM